MLPKYYFRLLTFLLVFFLWLYNHSLVYAQVQAKYTDSCLQFLTSRGEQIVSINPLSCISGIRYREKIKMRFGSFDFRENSKKYFNTIKNGELLEYDGSYFVTGELVYKHHLMPFEIGFFLSDSRAKQFSIYVKVTDTAQLLSAIRFELNSNAQHIYGFGEQFSYLDFAGKRIRTFTEENGIGRGDMPLSRLTKLVGVKGSPTSSYFPLPQFFAEQGNLYNTVPSDVVFDFTHTHKIAFETAARQTGNKFLLNITSDSTSALHTPLYQPLPDWAYGTVLGLQGGSERVERLTQQAIAAGNPVKAVWIQDWVGRRKVNFGSRLWWTWTPDNKLYPRLKQFIEKMNTSGVQVLGYINPFIVEESVWFTEAVQKNYLVKNQINKNYKVKAGGFDAYLIDLANAEACSWFKNIIKTQLIDNGFGGWMADFGEWLPLDAKLSGGFTGKEFHNFYAVAWARINREAVQEAGLEGKVVVFHRSGHVHSLQYVQMLWAGDQTTDFGYHDGFPSAIRAVLTSAASGVLYNHTDIGGYTNIDFGALHLRRNRELLYRWVEFAAFTPFFRTHEGLKPDKNLQVYSDSDAIRFFARLGQIHYALSAYMKASVPNNSGFSVPLIRPLYTHKSFENFAYEYLLGNDLLIAPVVQSGVQKLNVYFPEGEWMHVWDNAGTVYAPGETKELAVPLGKPAVFVRRGSEWEEKLLAIFRSF